MIAAFRMGTAVAALLLAANVTFGQGPQDRPQRPDQQQERPRTERDFGQAQRDTANQGRMQLIKFSALEDVTVKSKDGQDIGHIADVAVDPKTGQVAYAAVSIGGGAFGTDAKLHAVPLSSLNIKSSDEVVLNMDKQQLEGAEGFDENDWPNQPDSRFSAGQAGKNQADIRGQQADMQQRQQGQRITSIEQASNLVGMEVQNPQDEDLGEINDVFIDVENSRLAFASLSHGGVLGMGEEIVPVPWESFRIAQGDGDDQTLILNTTEEQLKQAPRWPELKKGEDQVVFTIESSRLASMYEFHRANPYWKTRG